MKLLKSFFLVVAILLVVAVIGIYFLYSYSQSPSFKGDVISWVEEETGRKLSIDGDLNLSFYPWAGIEIGNIMMENAKGFSERPFLKAERIAIRIKTLPLLSEQYELDTFVLHGLEMNLETDADGKTNWQDLAGGDADSDEGSSGEMPELAAVILGGVDVQNGIVRWDDERSNTHYEVKGITATTGPLTFGEPIDFQLSYQAKANQPAIEKDVNVDATLKYDLKSELYQVEPLTITADIKGKNIPGGSAKTSMTAAAIVFDGDKETLTIKDFNIDALGSSVKANLVADHINSKQPGLNGKLSADVDDMAALMKILEVEPLASTLAKQSQRKVSMNAEVSSDKNGHVDIPAFTAKGLGTELDMQLKASDLGADEPSVSGKLSLEGKDLPLMLQFAGAMQGKDSALTDASKELSSLQDKSFSIKSDFDFSDGKIELPSLLMKLLLMEVNASIKSQGGTQAAGTVSVKGEDSSLLLSVLGGLQGKESPLNDLAKDLKSSKDRSFSLTAGIDADMDKGKIAINDLLVKLLGANIEGEIDGEGLQTDAPGFEGTLKARGADFPALMRLLGSMGEGSSLAELGAQFSSMKTKSFDIDTAFELEQGSGDIDVSRLKANLLGLTANGQLKAKGLTSGNSNINGDIDVNINQPEGLLTAFGQGELAEVVKSIQLKAGLKGNNQSIELTPLDFKTTLSGKEIPNSPVDIAMTAKTQANLESETLSVKDLSLKGLGLDVKGNLNMTKFMSTPSFTGDINIAPINIRQFLTSLKQTVPVTADKNVLQSFSLSSAVKGSSRSLALNELTVKLDDTTMKGNVALTDFQTGAMTFGLGIDAFNTDRYLPALDTSTEAVPQKTESTAKSKKVAAAEAEKLPFDTLRDLNMKGDLLVGNLVYSNMKLKDVQISIDAKDSVLKMKPIKAELYGGNYSGDITLNTSGKSAKLTVNSNLKSVQLGPLEKDYMGTEQIVGNADVNLALFSAGSTINQLKQNLSGQGKIAVTDGVLQGIDVGKVLQEVEMMIEDKRIGKPTEGGETAFDSLTANLDINSGKVTNQDMLLKAPGFNVAGKGLLANLNDMSWNYDLLLSVNETTASTESERYNIGGYSIPAKCKGLIANKRCVPDVGSLLTTIFKKSLQDKLFEEIGLKKKDSAAKTRESSSSDNSKKNEKPKIEDIGKELLKGIFD